MKIKTINKGNKLNEIIWLNIKVLYLLLYKQL